MSAFSNIWVLQADFTVGAIAQNAATLLEAAHKLKAKSTPHQNASHKSNPQSTSHKSNQARLLVAGELALSGYPPQDLLLRSDFIKQIHQTLELIAAKAPMPMLFGAPISKNGKLYNAAVLVAKGKAQVVTHKTKLPNYGIFDELRLFSPATEPPRVFHLEGLPPLATLVCEDLWQPEPIARCAKAEAVIALNASPFEHQKPAARLAQAQARVKQTNKPLLYVNLFGGQDEAVFDGRSFALDQTARHLWNAPPWQQTLEEVKPTNNPPTSPKTSAPHQSTPFQAPSEFDPAETYQALVTGLRYYTAKTGFEKVLLGLSGGIDSSLTAAIAVDGLGADKVEALIMPSPYSKHSKIATTTAEGLLINATTLPISPLMEAFDHCLAKPLEGLAAENIQARLRAVLLMAKSNTDGSLLLTTGNKSESAVGYTTLYGDMCGGFSLLKDVYKTQAYRLARWRNQNTIKGFLGKAKNPIPQKVLTIAPSAELKQNQIDQDTLPPYDQLDEILNHLIEQNQPPTSHPNPKLAQKCWQLILAAEYKRSQAAPGVKVSKCLFGWDRRYPISNHFKT